VLRVIADDPLDYGFNRLACSGQDSVLVWSDSSSLARINAYSYKANAFSTLLDWPFFPMDSAAPAGNGTLVLSGYQSLIWTDGIQIGTTYNFTGKPSWFQFVKIFQLLINFQVLITLLTDTIAQPH